MSEELTIRPRLEAILEGQRRIVSQLVDLRTVGDSVSAKVDQIATRQNELAEKQDDLAGRQERLELRMAELGREVRDGLYYTNRAIGVFNQRVLDFELWLRKVDERLHDDSLITHFKPLTTIEATTERTNSCAARSRDTQALS
jgi:hypothetical protein